MSKKVYSVKEVKEALGISQVTAYQLVHSVGFPSVRVGKRILIPVDKFEEWLSEQAINQ